jgi:hypothetical protein
MTNKIIRKKLDYLPLMALIISALYLLFIVITDNLLLRFKQKVGLILLILPIVLFYRNHKLGVLSTGLIILLGLFGLLSYNLTIVTVTLTKSFGNLNVPFLFFQPIFIIWGILHFGLSGRYYIGVLSRRYWAEIKSDEAIKIE